METGLFGVMQDLKSGKPLPNVTDFSAIFAYHRARKAAEADRDVVAERYRRAVVGPDDAGYDTAPWLRGL